LLQIIEQACSEHVETYLLPGGKQKGCGAIRANRFTDNCFEGVIDVVAKLSKSRRLALMLGDPDLRARNRPPAAA